jgi:hypothetical protein
MGSTTVSTTPCCTSLFMMITCSVQIVTYTEHHIVQCSNNVQFPSASKRGAIVVHFDNSYC